MRTPRSRVGFGAATNIMSKGETHHYSFKPTPLRGTLTQVLGRVTMKQSLVSPVINEQQGVVSVRQRKIIGWALLAFSPGIPLVIWLASGRSSSAAWAEIVALDGFSLLGAGLIGLILAAVFAYGLFWLLWRRELLIDTAARRYVFVSGIGPLLSRHAGRCDDPLRLMLLRQRIGGMNLSGDIGSMSGADLEHWQLKLIIPGGREPLYLGDHADRAEATTAAERWRRWFPNLIVEDAR